MSPKEFIALMVRCAPPEQNADGSYVFRRPGIALHVKAQPNHRLSENQSTGDLLKSIDETSARIAFDGKTIFNRQ